MITCINCGEPIRPLDPEHDGVDPRDFDWVHDGGNPYCDWRPTAQPSETEARRP
jgi:hypothetical protein